MRRTLTLLALALSAPAAASLPAGVYTNIYLDGKRWLRSGDGC